MYKLEKIDINLHVKSLEETFEWYKSVLGWESGCDLANDKGECLFGSVHYSDYSEEPFIGFNLNKSDNNGLPNGFHLTCPPKRSPLIMLVKQDKKGGTNGQEELHSGTDYQQASGS